MRKFFVLQFVNLNRDTKFNSDDIELVQNSACLTFACRPLDY